jgi:hypothetical protein
VSLERIVEFSRRSRCAALRHSTPRRRRPRQIEILLHRTPNFLAVVEVIGKRRVDLSQRNVRKLGRNLLGGQSMPFVIHCDVLDAHPRPHNISPRFAARGSAAFRCAAL